MYKGITSLLCSYAMIYLVKKHRKKELQSRTGMLCKQLNNYKNKGYTTVKNRATILTGTEKCKTDTRTKGRLILHVAHDQHDKVLVKGVCSVEFLSKKHFHRC